MIKGWKGESEENKAHACTHAHLLAFRPVAEKLAGTRVTTADCLTCSQCTYHIVPLSYSQAGQRQGKKNVEETHCVGLLVA